MNEFRESTKQPISNPADPPPAHARETTGTCNSRRRPDVSYGAAEFQSRWRWSESSRLRTITIASPSSACRFLFGFQFNGVSQELFCELPVLSSGLAFSGLPLLMLTIGCLIARAM